MRQDEPAEVQEFIEVCRLLGWQCHLIDDRDHGLNNAYVFDIRANNRGASLPVSTYALKDRAIWAYLISQIYQAMHSHK